MRDFVPTAICVLTLCAATAQAQTPNVVRSTGPGAWGATLRLVEDQRIGLLEGDPRYTLGNVTQLVVLADGSVIIGESSPARLRMYGADGKFMREIGRDGEGPGEYRQINGLKPMGGGFALWDGRIGRISVFDAKGEFQTSHRYATGFFTADVFQVDLAGNFYVKAQAERMEPGQFTVERKQVWVKLNPRGEVVDSIPIPMGTTPTVQLYGGPRNSRVETLVSAFSPAGYFVTGDPRTYAFQLQPFSQRTSGAEASRRTPPAHLRIERAHTPVALTRGERNEWEAYAEYLSKQPIGMMMRVVNGRPDTLRGPSVRYTAPQMKPAYRAITVDQDGMIWVERYVTAQQTEPTPLPANAPARPQITWREPVTYDLFEPNGRFNGTIVVPANVTLRARRGMHFYGVMRGEFDEQYVVRYRVQAAAR